MASKPLVSSRCWTQAASYSRDAFVASSTAFASSAAPHIQLFFHVLHLVPSFFQIWETLSSLCHALWAPEHLSQVSSPGHGFGQGTYASNYFFAIQDLPDLVDIIPENLHFLSVSGAPILTFLSNRPNINASPSPLPSPLSPLTFSVTIRRPF